MRHRPIRKNYPRGKFGDINYYERLERYCTYLENKNKALTEQCNIPDVVGRSEQLATHQCKFYVNADWTKLKCECGKEKLPSG
jgi:hypothetical protein